MKDINKDEVSESFRKWHDPNTFPDEHKIKDGKPCKCCGAERFKWYFPEEDFIDETWKFGCQCWRFSAICDACRQCALHCEHYDKEATRERIQQKDEEISALISEAYQLCESLGLDMDEIQGEDDVYQMEKSLRVQLRALERYHRRNSTWQHLVITLHEFKRLWGERGDAGETFGND